MLDRRCRKHDAKLRKLISQPLGQLGIGTLAQQHDRTRGGFKLLTLDRVDLANARSLIGVGKHHGECLAVAMLALA